MTTIPDDIMEAARKVHLEILGRGIEKTVGTIASAIMAERRKVELLQNILREQATLIGQLQVDADRYRWLRDLFCFSRRGGGDVGATLDKLVVNEEDCDRFVDAGMRAGK